MDEFFTKMTQAEAATPYAKYFNREKAIPNPTLIEILSKGAMNPNKALPYQNINALLDVGYQEVETGYCVLENGVGYVAANNVFPNCSVDMLKWWFSWHGLEDIRYKLWCPQKHGGVTISSEDRKKILDSNISIDQKYTNVTHLVVEDVGAGFDDITINFLKPEAIGFDTEKLEKSPVKAIFGGFGITQSRANPAIKSPAVMIHTCREIENGVEFRTRFYMGCAIENGKIFCALPEGVSVPEIAPMGLAFHNVEEFSNLAAILPEIYAEFGPNIN